MLHTTLLFITILALGLVLQQHQASSLPTFKGVDTRAYPRSLFANKNIGGVQMRGIDSPDKKGHNSNSNNSTNELLGLSCTPKDDVWACRGKVFMTCTFQDRVWVSEETCQIECVKDPAIRPLCFRNSNGTAVETTPPTATAGAKPTESLDIRGVMPGLGVPGVAGRIGGL
ncbi:hypothetical protein DFJ77DRAFT_462877 [Powellomyces hirtus]|nr:hypothetical protein DFJ77DRAFT_462877 [Powellomyces hirtus]